jgi:hypothetical protein
MGLFYLIRVIFRLDEDMAMRFRLRFTRPAVQASLHPAIRDILDRAWDESTATLDLREVVERKVGLIFLADAIEKLGWEYEDSRESFIEMADLIFKATQTTIVDRVGWLDEGFQHRVHEVKTAPRARESLESRKRPK